MNESSRGLEPFIIWDRESNSLFVGMIVIQNLNLLPNFIKNKKNAAEISAKFPNFGSFAKFQYLSKSKSLNTDETCHSHGYMDEGR